MSRNATTGTPTVLFGAFDRHNFGDLLFPHVVARMLGRDDVRFAGIATRDLRPYGGHQVSAVCEVAASARGGGFDLVHVGGELLTCDAWEAGVMLSSPEPLQAAIAGADDWQRDRLAWAASKLGMPTLAPYVLSKALLPRAGVNRVFFNAVGGVELDARDPALRAQVVAALGAADDVSVRDRRTQALLSASGVAARLVPDPAVMVAELFGTRIRRQAACGPVKAMLEAFPRGYAAVQFSADFGDDASLDAIARELDAAMASSGLGVVLFRAGAAPWHDDLACYERLVSRMRAAPARIFTALNLWDICALIAHSRVYCGSSLHGRIVAMGFALPRVGIGHRGGAAKQTAFAQTWEPAETAATVGVHDIADAIGHALSAAPALLEHTARELANRYREGFAELSARLG